MESLAIGLMGCAGDCEDGNEVCHVCEHTRRGRHADGVSFECLV
jgi:hypothetical protein